MLFLKKKKKIHGKDEEPTVSSTFVKICVIISNFEKDIMEDFKHNFIFYITGR